MNLKNEKEPGQPVSHLNSCCLSRAVLWVLVSKGKEPTAARLKDTSRLPGQSRQLRGNQMQPQLFFFLTVLHFPSLKKKDPGDPITNLTQVPSPHPAKLE